MARNFQKMKADELFSFITDGDFSEMGSAELSQLRNAAKNAGVLSVQIDNILGLAINNQTYKDIKDSKEYSAEDKAFALEARNDYNQKLRSQMNDKYYNAEEIMSRATFEGGKYHFTELSKGEMDFLLEKGAVKFNDLDVNKDYKIGQEKATNLASIIKAIAENAEKRELLAQMLPALAENAAKREAAEKTVDDKKEISKKEKIKTETPASQMPADLQKSYDFWNKFNEKTEKSGVKFNIENLSNQALLVAAEKNGKTMFQGIDHGSKGFDIVKRDKSAEPYEIFDLLVKKAKASNPKTKIRIKDNVKDEVLRNKILIACAKNNMTPIGNLPEGFDFEELKALVKDLKTTEEINELATSLYQPQEFGISAKNEGNNDKSNTAIVVNADDERMFGNRPKLQMDDVKKEPEVKKEAKKETSSIIPAFVPLIGGNNSSQSTNDNNDGSTPPLNRRVRRITPALIPSGNGGNLSPSNTGGAQPQANKSDNASTAKRWWNKARVWVVAVAVTIAAGVGGFFGAKQANKDNDAKMKAQTEQITKNTRQIVDNACNEKAQLQAALDASNARLKDCEESKIPVKSVVQKKKVNKVITPAPVKPAPVVIPGDTIYEQDVIIPGKRIQLPDEIIPGKKIQQPDAPVKSSSVPLEEVDGSIRHEKDYDLNESRSLDSKGKVIKESKMLDLSNPEVFNAFYKATQNIH